MYPPNKACHHTISAYDITHRATPHAGLTLPYRVPCHTHTVAIPPRGSTIRGHEKSMPHIKDNDVEPRGSTIRAQLCRSICSRSNHRSATGAHIYSTATQSNSPTQPSTARFSVYSMNSQPSPRKNSSSAGGVENSSQTAQAKQESSHATSVSGLWDRRVHWVGCHCVNAYYPLVGLELGGALVLRPMCRVVPCALWCWLCCVCSI